MALKVITCSIIFFISHAIIWIKGDVTMLSLLKSLQTTQELLDAYNDGDYIKTGIKLIEIKLIADPPPKHSREEQLLLASKKYLENIYPYYYKIHERNKTTPSLQDVRDLQYEDIVEQAINNLDNIIYNMGMKLDNLQHSGSFASRGLEYELLKDNNKALSSIEENMLRESTGQLLNLFNNYTMQISNIFSDAVDDFTVED